MSVKIETAVACTDLLGETPLWCDQTNTLWWIDIEKPTLHALNPAGGAHRSLQMPGTWFGCIALTDTDKLLAAVDLTLVLVDPDTGATTPFAEVERDIDNRLNDGRVDPAGRLWIGTMANGLSQPNGSVYRVDPDGSVTKMFGDVIVTNGIAHAPDNRRLYFTDTRRYCTWVFDVDPDDGTLRNRRIFADYTDTGDRPDGACIDVDGCLWAAFFAGSRVVRYRPDGKIDLSIPLPVTNPTCLCFGGKDLKTLYIPPARKFLSDERLASEPLAGALLAIEGIGQGLPENRFRLSS